MTLPLTLGLVIGILDTTTLSQFTSEHCLSETVLCQAYEVGERESPLILLILKQKYMRNQVSDDLVFYSNVDQAPITCSGRY